jgi:hypothetical protein
VHDSDRTAEALSRLDPASRALVELSYRRGLDDDEIGDLLQVGPEEVARRRETALARVGLIGEQLRRLDDDDWKPGGRPAPAGLQRAAPAKRRVPVAALAVLALIAAVVLVVAIASGGGGDEGEGDVAQTPTTSDTAATTQETATTPASSARPMQRLNGTYGHGTAQLVRSGDRTVLRLDVTDFLRPQGGGYAVWLFNSPDDARRLFATSSTTIERDFPLPEDFTRYRYAEVARAIPDLDSDHSGLTLLRSRISALATP